MHVPMLINDLALILATAGVVTVVFRRLNQPLVLGYIVAGFLVSPTIAWLPNVADAEAIAAWSEIGVVFLMFGLGLSFSIVQFSTIGRPAFVTAVVEMGLTMAAGVACGFALGWPPMTSLFLGGMLAISSTNVIAKTFDETGVRGRRFADLVFGVLVVEDIVVVFLMVVLATVAAGSTADGALFEQLGRMGLYLVAWLMLSVAVVPSVLRKFARVLNDEMTLVVSTAFCFVMVLTADAIGFSSALGAFLAGSVLAGTAQAQRIAELFKPLKSLFGAVFFVSVGMLVSPDAIVANVVPIVAIALVPLLGKPLFVSAGALVAGQSLKTAVRSGMSMAQIGEFSFIIAALGSSLGVTSESLYPVVVSVSVVTVFLTPCFIRSADRAYDVLARVVPQGMLERVDRSDGNRVPLLSGPWAGFMKRWALEVGAVVVAALVLAELLPGVVKPLLGAVCSDPALSVVLTAVGVGFESLFIANLFYRGRKGSFGRLWAEKGLNRALLALLAMVSLAVSACSAAWIALSLGAGNAPGAVLASVVLALLLGRSRVVHSHFLRYEAAFLANLHENVIEERMADAPEDDRSVRRRLSVVKASGAWEEPIAADARKTPLSALGFAYGLDLLAIEREGAAVGACELARLTREQAASRMQSAGDLLNARRGDVLSFIGCEDEVEAYGAELRRRGWVDCEGESLEVDGDDAAGGGEGRVAVATFEAYADGPHAGFLCQAFTVQPTSRLAGAAIVGSGLKSECGCLVVALERRGLLRLKPSRNMRFAPGDRVWLVGTPEDIAGAGRRFAAAGGKKTRLLRLGSLRAANAAKEPSDGSGTDGDGAEKRVKAER